MPYSELFGCPYQGGRMFRTKKRSEEPDPKQEPRNPPSPKELLAKEAQMAEKLLEDLVPEEPPSRKDTEGQKPEVKAEATPPGQAGPVRPGVPTAPAAAKPEEKPAAEEKKPEEEKSAEPAEKQVEGAGPVGDDQLPVLMERIQQLGNDLVGIRSEIRKLREGYASKTKDMEELQAKLKEMLTQVG
jgi:hypothetical protein